MSNLEAMRLSLAMSRSDLPREVKDQVARSLFDHYRDLLASRLLPIVPTTRRVH